MDLIEKFWSQIALDIEKEYKKEHPSKWKRATIEIFRDKMREKLVRLCKTNLKKAKLCNFKLNQNNQFDFQQFEVVTYSAFLRIFQNKTSKGKDYTRNQFAIYFGFNSFEEYVNKKDLDNIIQIDNIAYNLPPIPEYLKEENFKAPYLGLRTFSAKDSPLFFGRKKELLSMINYLNEKQETNNNQLDFKNLILLFGQTGVGKSSLLYAGVLPRLTEDWDITYERRDPLIGLAEMFRESVREKPKLLLFDQVESVFNLTESEPKVELENFSNKLRLVLNRPQEEGTKVIIAVDPKQLDIIATILKQTINETSSTILKQEVTETEQNFIDKILDNLTQSNLRIFIVCSLGKRHNLWKLLNQNIRNKWWLRYKIRKSGTRLEQLLEQIVNDRKKLIILDQVEEAITKENEKYSKENVLSGDNLEIMELTSEIKSFLNTQKNYKILLSFRADFLAQIEDLIDQRLTNRYKKWLIKPLDEDGVKDAIEGPLAGGYFHLKYYSKFVEHMIYTLKQDDEANIAPALQIILKKLWDLVKNDTRYISKELFTKNVSKEGAILELFLKEQLAELKKKFNKNN